MGAVASLIPVLRTQFHIAWSLLQLHLRALTTDDWLWSPASEAWTWTVRRRQDDKWVPDWSSEPVEPLPIPTIAWLTWHIGWWWTTTIAYLAGAQVPDRTAVVWPGSPDATTAWLGELHRTWSAVLGALSERDLDAAAPFPWPPGTERTVADMAAWVNVELMKNAAEIGQLRILRAALQTRW